MNSFESVFRSTPELLIATKRTGEKSRVPRKVANAAPESLAERWSKDPAVKEIQNRLTGLNIFTALNATDYEARHSDFLAWLFAAKASHGAGSEFLKRFLSLAAERTNDPSVARAVRTLLRDPSAFTEATVERERHERVDLLVVDRNARFVCLVENKIHSGEHSGQLTRYRNGILKRFPDYRHLFVFLSLRAEEPSDPAYIPITYAELFTALDQGNAASARLSTDEMLALLFSHYVEFVSEVEKPIRGPNLFSALGLREIKHSDFYAWLLNPRETHGLGIKPLAEFMRLVRGQRQVGNFPSNEIGEWRDLEIYREEQNIDILIVSERAKFVCLIENKLDAREGPDQLQRYKAYVRRWYPGFCSVFVFFTLRGDVPTDPDYVAMRFRDFAPFLQEQLKSLRRRELKMRETVDAMVEQYRVLLSDRLHLRVRAHTEIAPGIAARIRQLCQREDISVGTVLAGVRGWQQSVALQIESFIGELIEKYFGQCFRPAMFPGALRSYLVFVPPELDAIPPLLKGGKNGRLFDFLVLNRPFFDPSLEGEPFGITVIATLRGARSGFEPLRSAILDLTLQDRSLFTKSAGQKQISRKNCRILSHTLVTSDDFQRLELSEVKAKLNRRFKWFAEHQYPDVLKLLRNRTVVRYRAT